MKKKATKKITIDIDGIYCGRNCLFMNMEFEDYCHLYNKVNDFEFQKGWVYVKYKRCKKCIKEFGE